MSENIHDESRPGSYQRIFLALRDAGESTTDAATASAEAYLADKPGRRGKKKLSAAERHADFWTSEFLTALPAGAYLTEQMILALTRYMRQDKTSNPGVLERIASVAPEAVRRAARYSGLVQRPTSPRWKELESLAVVNETEFGEFVRIFRIFDRAHRERVADVEQFQNTLMELSPLELLCYASLFAFEHLVPRLFSQNQIEDPDNDTQTVWDAINDILIWKLKRSSDEAFHLTEASIGKSLRAHLSPFLFPSADGPRRREDLYRAFNGLLAAQIELNSFLDRSVDAFSYDDGISFVLRGGSLEIVERDAEARAAWARNGEKLARLHNYWFYRALHSFAASEMVTAVIGRPENHEANRVAYIKAMRTRLQLTEVYGVETSVVAESGMRVDLFTTLLSLELMTAFFTVDYMQPYAGHLNDTGNWRMALGRLALGGLLQPDSQNRFPVTWSDREAKIEKIRPWTVGPDSPQGSDEAAEAILDFWTSDWRALAARLRAGDSGLAPELLERPVLKMGRYLFQLPWVVAMQNNSTAAINNLRRLGARRDEAREETRRIEQRLAALFEERNFRVVLNYRLERTDDDDPGEVDLICARDGQLLVLEIKSTYLRRSKMDAWLHRTTTLRKAALQLRRKIGAVRSALASDASLAPALGIEADGPEPEIRGWIVDTSIEHDLENVGGFLKVSLEGVLIALRDDRHFLNDPEGLFAGREPSATACVSAKASLVAGLYPDGFSAGRFVSVVESGAVWSGPPPAAHFPEAAKHERSG